MDIFHPDKHTFSLIKDFVKPYEEKCVLLCSHVRKEDEKVFVIVDTETSVEKTATSTSQSQNCPSGMKVLHPSAILAVIYVDSTLFHCIPSENIPTLKKNSPFISSTLSKILGGKKIKCVSGESSGTDFFLELLTTDENKPYQINNYNLMTLKNLPATWTQAPLSNGDEIIRCTGNDMDRLKPVQHKYLQEEVAPRGKKVSDLEVAMTLRQTLKSQLCLAVVSDGEIAAKANTNAIGVEWVQVGGVYTCPLYRRNGYALHLVYTICRRALKVGKNVALFVKEKNNPAIELYKRIGFIESGKYKIGYF